MAEEVSFNGYVASKDPTRIPHGLVWISPKGAPNVRFRVRGGDVATVLQEVIDRFHAEVEDTRLYTKGDDWGYAYRPIRGSTTRLSNHASGTAVDINATRHPLGTHPSANFTAKQIAAIRRIVRDLEGTVIWGGDYSGRKDPMHFEIDATPEDLARVARKIREKNARPLPTPRPPEDDLPSPADVWNADAIPNPFGNEKDNPKVTPGVLFGKFWARLTGVHERLARVEESQARIEAKLDALAGKPPTP